MAPYTVWAVFCNEKLQVAFRYKTEALQMIKDEKLYGPQGEDAYKWKVIKMELVPFNKD